MVLVDELLLRTTGRSEGLIFSAISSQLLKAVTATGSGTGVMYCLARSAAPEQPAGESGWIGSSNWQRWYLARNNDMVDWRAGWQSYSARTTTVVQYIASSNFQENTKTLRPTGRVIQTGCRTCKQGYVHVEIIVTGIVGVQDELLGGIGPSVEEDILDGKKRV